MDIRRYRCGNCGSDDITMIPKTCKIEDCANKAHAKELCSKHYRRQWLYGDPHVRHGRTGRKIYDDDRLLMADDFWARA